MMFEGFQPPTCFPRCLELAGVDLGGTHAMIILALDFATLSDLTIVKYSAYHRFLAALYEHASDKPLRSFKKLTLYHF